jgi:DNA-binding CsgD family transcriptional regulator
LAADLRTRAWVLLPISGWEGHAEGMEAVPTAHLTRARELHTGSRWEEACAEYAAADAEQPLAVEDLERYAEAAQVSARGDEAVALLHRVFDLRVSADEPDDAAQVAFWLWWALLNNNEVVQASGWLKQTSRTLGPDVATSLWLKIPEAMFHGTTGNRSRADELLRAIVDEGQGEVVPWALSMWGQTLIDEGRLQDGLDRLEEAMAILFTHGLSPRVTPWIYCAAVRGCCLARDFGRARAWNRSMVRWLDSLSSLGGAYLGNCRIYRSRLMCLNGAWPDALDEIAAVCTDLDGHTGWVCGHAYYQLGEVRRLRGEWSAAEEAYRRAAEHGCPTQPGLALLRLAEGDVEAASAGVRRALTEVTAKPDRLDLLKAAVTIYLQEGKIDAARDAVTEFEGIAGELTTPVIEAEATAVRGALALSEGDPGSALPLLRRAVGTWQEQDAPHEVAKLNVLIGRACRALDDHDGARLEFSAARETFERLGARPDLARLDTLVASVDAGSESHGLTPREIEVLTLVARGRTNREIATHLHLSERTVHRHLSNIFTKLDVDSRTAAATYGIKHHIVEVGAL